MKNRLRTLPFACALAVPFLGAAQSLPVLNDPANLAGERVAAAPLSVQLPINQGAAALEQLLRKLRTRASMMLIVAHPDDEDSGLLTYESRGVGARVAMLTLTRGEGGQNLMSGDFDDALGLIRTQELLAEDRYTGTDQMFGTEVDFGFSKTKEEAFAKWTHERVLYDAVRAVRLYRPLVLASVFVGGPTDGHGHHQVAGEITQEVFKAAADPNVFPEMIKDGLLPWAPLKVYARVPFSRVTAEGMFDYATGKTIPPRFENYVTGVVTDKPPVATVMIHEGDKPNIAAFAGMSYVQFARQGLALQKSQIGAGFRVPPAGVFDVGYTLMGSRLDCGRDVARQTGCPLVLGEGNMLEPNGFSKLLPADEKTIFDGIDISLAGIANLAGRSGALTVARSGPPRELMVRERLTAIDALLAGAQASFDPFHPATIASPLSKSLALMNQLIADVEQDPLRDDGMANVLHELKLKRVQLNAALTLALSVEFTATADKAEAPVVATSVQTAHHAAFQTRLAHDPLQPLTLEYTAPYWTENVSLPASERPANDGSKPFLPHKLDAELDLPNGITTLDAVVTRPYFTRGNVEQPFYDLLTPALRNAPETPAPYMPADYLAWQDQVFATATTVHDAAGAELVVVPPVSVTLTPGAGIVPAYKHVQVQLTARLQSESRTPVTGMVHLEVPIGWRASPAALPFTVGGAGDAGADLVFTVTPGLIASSDAFHVTAVATVAGKAYREGYRAVGYAGLQPTNYYTPATARFRTVDVMTEPGLRVAYLRGTGDDVPAYLPDLGVTPVLLDVKDLSADKLRAFDEVILGVRAYAAHPELSGAGSRPLLEFARGGGIVVVEYNSGGFNPASAPYPYELPGDSAHNVVEEAQPVTLLEPDAPLLTWPNRITSADFDGWVAERGHGFASSWAPEYAALLEAHDVGQDPQRGGLLVATVGKGAYVYCALALYRQLPETVPGAYRLLANLLSYSKNPHRADASH